MSQLVKIGLVRPNLVALRPAQLEDEKFLALEANIKQLGFLSALRVRPKTDEATGETYYELINGLQRFTIAQRLGFEEVPVEMADADDMRVLVEQIALNATQVDTKPAQYGQQLLRVLEKDPTMTIAGLADMTGMSEGWVSQRLALNKLVPQIATDFVDAGQITASNAYQLSRLPQEEQVSFVEQAQTADAAEFAAAINSRLKEIRKARAAGRDPSRETAEFEPSPTLRKAGEIKVADAQTIILEVGASSALEGAKAALDWVLQMNPSAITAQKERYNLRRQRQMEERAAKQLERAGEMQKKAADRAEELKRQLGLV